jgi:hypothetical protein
MVSHLRAVLAFLDTHETKDRPARYLDPRKILERRHRATRTAIKDAERQLARAARSQRRIVDLFGPSSHTYEAATNAVNETGNALGDYLEMTRWRRSAFESETPYPQRITNAHDALDAFTVTVERWKAAVR